MATIKELAETAGFDFDDYYDNVTQEELERFAELIRQDERDKCAQDYLQDCCDAVEAARLEEREACAKLCESKMIDEYATGKVDHNEQAWTDWCAAAIRQRGEQP